MSARAFNQCVAATARDVADELGNTPAVCRKSYINPVVFDAWRSGALGDLIPVNSVASKRLEKLALQLLRAHKPKSAVSRKR